MAEIKIKTDQFKHKEPDGDSGVVSLNYVDEFVSDYSSELVGRTGMVKLWKFAIGDPVAGMMLRGIKNIIKSAKWQIVDVDDMNKEEEAAWNIANNYFFSNPNDSFKNKLNQFLTMCEFGHSVFEKYWKPYNYEGNVYLVPVLEQRIQTSIEKFNNTKREIEFIKSTGETAFISYDNLVIFVLDQISTDYRGKSILREAYSAYRDRLYYDKIMGIGAQRAATGTPHAKVPAGTTKDSPKYKAIKTMLSNMISHEKAYMITEADTEFKIEQQNFDPEKILKVMDYKDTKMVMSILMQFLLLGQGGNGGAYALGQDQSDFFLSGISYIVELIEEVIHSQIMIPFLSYNFPNIDPDRIKIRGLDLNKNVNKEMAEIINLAIGNKLIKPEPQDEIVFRKLYNMADLTDEQYEQRVEQSKNGSNDDDTGIQPGGDNDSSDSDSNGDNANVNGQNKQINNLKLSEKTQSGIAERKKTIDSEQRRISLFMKEQLYYISDKLLVDIKNILDSGSVELKGLKNIELRGIKKYQKVLSDKVAGLIQLGWLQEKKKAKRNKVKLAEDIDPKELESKDLQAFSQNYAEQLVDDQTETLKAQAIYNAQNGIMRGLSVDQTMSKVEKATNDFIEGAKIATGAGLAVVTSINFGMNEFNDSIKSDLQGFRFVAVDDDVTSEICRWYNGKTFSVDSAELASSATPPLHPNCRSYLEPIYKAEEKINPDDAVAPPSIQKQQSI